MQNSSKKVSKYLLNHNTEGLEIHIKSPVEATKIFFKKESEKEKILFLLRGMFLRDYLTDFVSYS